MLHVLTNQGYLALEQRENFSIVYDYEGEQQLSFDISPLDSAYKNLHENTKLLYKDNQYLIRKINKRKNIATIEANLNLNDWKRRIHQQFDYKDKLFSEIMLLVKPDGWTLENMGIAKGRSAIKLEGCSDYEILMECKQLFGIVFEFHTRDKKIKVIDPSTVQQRGLYMSDELNLDSVEYKGDSSNYANRLYAYGKETEIVQDDGSKTISYVTFASINEGKEYVEQRTDEEEIISAYWQDNEYEDSQELLTAAREKVKGLATPIQSWSCNLYDLSRTNILYRMLDFKLYDKPVLLLAGNAILHQIVEYTEYPDNQNLNKVVLSTTFKKIQGELSTIKTNVDKLDESMKYSENVVNELRQDVKSNSALIENTYRKEDVDHRLSTIIQQTDESITTSVGAVEEKVQVIEHAKRYHMEVLSSQGTIFKNGFISTVLSVKLFSWDTDVTTIITDTAVTWRRYSANATLDQNWSRTGKSITITPADLTELAVFECRWNTVTQRISIVVVYDGEEGTPGLSGKDGKTTYFHVKYAPVINPTDSQIKENPDKFIGTYVDDQPNDSTLAGMYTWAKFQGDAGIAGTNGNDGKTSYLHIRYSNDAGQSFTVNNGKLPGDYLGQYTDFNEADSTNVASYSWTKIKGEQGLSGPKGTDGTQYYTWLKYADTPTSGMSDLPANKTYMGLAYNKNTAMESTNYADYTWSLIKGDKGEQGVSGPSGSDGKQLYTWVKYANDSKGTGLSDDPTGKLYIGLAYNKTTATESTVASDYTWSLIKGDKGDIGPAGAAGVSITLVEVYYYLSTSNTTLAGGSWVTSAPVWADGKYMWQKTKTTMSNGSIKESEPICVTGGKGQTGSTGSAGIGVKSTVVTYQASASGVTAPTGTWLTSVPSVAANQYLWTRTVITYTDNTTSTSYSIGLMGAAGPQGSTGATGKGVSSITAEYYLSTAKTTPTGGSWITSSPAWSTGKYIWTRSKISYTDSTVSYTAPLCDNSWEAVNDIHVGDRNLILKSNIPYNSNSYLISTYSFGDYAPQEGEEVTILLKGQLGTGKTSFGIYNSGGNVCPANLTLSDQTNGVYKKTVIWKTTSGSIVAPNHSVHIYTMPSTATTSSTIEWVKIVRGNKCSPDWTPAPEDVLEEIGNSETRITETYEALINQTKKEINLSVNSLTTRVGNTIEQVSGLQNQLVLTNEQTAFIKTTTDKLKDVVNGKVDTATIEEWARFNGSELTLGASNSPFYTMLSNTELSFWQGNMKVAWISNNELKIANSVIMEILKVGNWQCRDEGNAGLTWRRV